jgi:O-antigen biosynthesis protein
MEMRLKTLKDLFREHTGKVSDKWSSYLETYNRLFFEFREKEIKLLEIGIQNGGSLEIWSKYFLNAKKIIGCDINPDCGKLTFDSSLFAVIVGDATTSATHSAISEICEEFNIIIDDGSHSSGDIIKSFCHYFPMLGDKGVFIVEDLHCSYWSQFEGGLFYPFSSISFFKRLADIINYEHWGVSKSRIDILRNIWGRYGCVGSAEALTHIHSIEFINSMCVIRKASAAHNMLGHHVFAGSAEMIVPLNLEFRSLPYEIEPIYDQSENPWAARETTSDEEFAKAEQDLLKAQLQAANLEQQVAQLTLEITVLRNSKSWRMTAPFRFLYSLIRKYAGKPEREGGLLPSAISASQETREKSHE